MRRILATLLVAITTTVVLGAAPAAHAADPGAEADFANRVNALRASHGLAPVGLHSVLTAKAEGWAQHMADTGCLCHSNLPDGVTVGWRKLGENIGRGPSVASIHDALVNSPLHYANMVDPSFHWIGVGVAYGGGLMYVAEVFMDGDPPPAPATGWWPWIGVGGTLRSAPASASWAPNRRDVFATSSGGSLVHKWSDGAAWSSGWENLSHPSSHSLATAPTAVSWGPNRIDVFAAADNSSLRHRWWDGTRWSAWENLGGDLRSAPTVASWQTNRLDVFARASGGALQHKFWNGTRWSGWESLGGIVVGDPAAVSWAPNRVDVFVRGNDNAMWHRWWNGIGWGVWESLGGTLTTGPTAASWAQNRIDVFVRGTDRALYHRWWDGAAWRGYEFLGGVLATNPSAVSGSWNRIDVFVGGTDQQLWQRAWG